MSHHGPRAAAAGAVLLVIGIVSVASGQTPGSGQGAGTGPNSPQGQAGAGAGVASPSTIFVPPESGGALHEAPVIRAHNGVLKASVDMIRAGTPGSGRPTLYGNLPIFSNPEEPPPTPQGTARPPHFPLNFAGGYRFTQGGTTYPAQFPAPTLQLEPGDTLDLTMRDRLDDEKTGTPLPEGADLTNFHAHGLRTSPLGDGDNPFRTMNPNVDNRTLIKVPRSTASGFDWYHPHHHGFVSDQVYAGFAGAMMIGDPLDPWPQLKGKYTERMLALTAGITAPDPVTGERTIGDLVPQDDDGKPEPYGGTWRKYVNGQYNPTMTIRPGETQVWNVGSFTRNGNFDLGLTDADGQNPWSATLLAYDGKETDLVPRALKLALPTPFVPNGPTVLDEGARLTLAVTAPTTPGTYYLVDDAPPTRRPQGRGFFALATIKVEGAPVTDPAPVFGPTGAVPDLYTAKPDHKRTMVFNTDTSGEAIKFSINGSFFPDSPMTTLQVGQVEEWLLVNTSNVDHPFHLHQGDFAVMAVNTAPINYQNPFTDATPYKYTSLRDTVTVPPGGSVAIRFRVPRELGKYVFHCHILPHEDAGMMMGLLALPNPTQRRTALGTTGAGQSGAVRVEDGNGRLVGRIPGTGGTVASATGELTGDMTEDVVVGRAPHAGSAATIDRYDGKTMKRIGHFTPFPESPLAGVSVAVGNIQRDGTAAIVAGRVGPGGSLVRIFRRDGTLLREIGGTLPGNLPHGVTVASADFNGDNYDDVAIGGGRGSAPRVVGLDGYALGDPKGKHVPKLFALRAAGDATAGVSLAAGYFDPRTRPGIVANLVTSPLSGRGVGTVKVWTPMMPAEHGVAAAGAPQLMATLRPFAQRSAGGLHLAVAHLGNSALNTLAAWSNPRTPAYLSISRGGVVSSLHTPIAGGRATMRRLGVARLSASASVLICRLRGGGQVSSR